jgi:hypothetical protein
MPAKSSGGRADDGGSGSTGAVAGRVSDPIADTSDARVGDALAAKVGCEAGVVGAGVAARFGVVVAPELPLCGDALEVAGGAELLPPPSLDG